MVVILNLNSSAGDSLGQQLQQFSTEGVWLAVAKSGLVMHPVE